MSGTKLLRSRSLAMAACVFALSVVIWSIPGGGLTSEVLEQKFDGIVVPRLWVQVVPQVDGVISRILVAPGQHVSKGDVLFEMDADAFAIDVRMAQSEFAVERARLSLAEDAAKRQAELLKTSSRVSKFTSYPVSLTSRSIP
jgi:multidrug efflux pump subunit AcrA (membrane-fusion protein)